MKKRKIVYTTLSSKEYSELVQHLEITKQSRSEFILMSLAVFLNEDRELEKEKRDKLGENKKLILARCSDHLFNKVQEYAESKGWSKSEVVAQAIRQSIKG